MNKPKKKVGRPRKKLFMDELTRLCQIQCTAVECAYVLGMSDVTLDKRLHEETGEGFLEFNKRHSSEGKVSLRREQYVQAMGGNITMLIWLGKQWLDQRDQQNLRIGDPDGKPLDFTCTYRMAKARE